MLQTKIFDCTIFHPAEDNEALRKNDNPYWAKIWHSSIAMCNFLLENKSFITSKRILEIGAGLGLPSLVAAKYAKSVLCTDISNEALQYVDKSIAHNNCLNMKTKRLDWNNAFDYSNYDTVLLSDVNYDEAHFDYLSLTIQTIVNASCTVILTSPQRLIAKGFIEKISLLIQKQHEIEVMHNTEKKYISVFVLKID